MYVTDTVDVEAVLASIAVRISVLCLLCVATLATSALSFSISRSTARSCRLASLTLRCAALELADMVPSTAPRFVPSTLALVGLPAGLLASESRSFSWVCAVWTSSTTAWRRSPASSSLRLSSRSASDANFPSLIRSTSMPPRRTVELSTATLSVFESIDAGSPRTMRRCVPAGISTCPVRVTAAASR